MINDIKKVDGVKLAVSLDSILGPTIPDDMVPDEAKEIFKNGDYQMMLVSSKYATASDEVNNQITEIKKIVKNYSEDAMLIGEAPCTKDLITTKYRKNRYTGMDKKPAITKALADSTNSVIVSALCFFAATFGVGLYSNIDMISSICILLARGAIISMFVVVFILPSMFMIFDKVICATSAGFKNKNLTA